MTASAGARTRDRTSRIVPLIRRCPVGMGREGGRGEGAG